MSQDWGFSVPHLTGNISLVVLAIGSISPGLLQVAIGSFSTVFPDYQERIARHEAAHFLVAYLTGLTILGYSLDIGKEHVNLVDDQLQKLLYSGRLDQKEVDSRSAVAALQHRRRCGDEGTAVLVLVRRRTARRADARQRLDGAAGGVAAAGAVILDLIG